MGTLLKTVIRIKGGTAKRSLDRAAKCPQEVQTTLLLDILRRNRGTIYGQEYGFSQITTTDAFAKTIPINTFSDLSPYVEKMKSGQKNILISDQPSVFNLTSGTTDEPKYVPITRRGMTLAAAVSNQWLYRALQDHPSFLDHSILSISAAPVEGATPSGVPYGSASGMIFQALPNVLHRSFVLPFVFSDIKDYDLRYYLMARLAFEKNISFIVTPNPTTLIRIMETAIQHQEEIIRSIHDGVLFCTWSLDRSSEDARVLDSIGNLIRPNRPRADFLQRVVGRHGKLTASACWKELQLVGCWLGGSIGFQAKKLAQYFGEGAPKRDIGYLASEASITIPYQDNTPAGILALQNNYYEFILDDENITGQTRLLGCHEIEQGKRYKIVLTNWNGLYRYDIHDVIEVCGFYNRTPVISFVRKAEDMLNITGEKLHVNHLLKAFHRVEEEHDLSVIQFRVIPNYEDLRYELLMTVESTVPEDFLKNTILPFIDEALSEANIEYDGKRKSKRLNPPCIHVMDPSWEENVRKHFMEAGRRDIQYKWRMVGTKISDLDARHIRYTVRM